MAIMTKEELYKMYIVQGLSQSEIAKIYSVTPKNINYYVRKYELKGLKERIKYPINENKADTTNPIFCYFGGLMATDGHINYENNRVCLRVNNEGSDLVLQSLLEYFECFSEVAKYKTGNEIRITSRLLIQELEKLEIRGRTKTYTLTFPKTFHSKDCYRMFLRGVLDGDGNINLRKSKYTNNYVGGQFRIVTSSRDFIQGLKDSLNNYFNFSCKISYHNTRGVHYPKLEMSVEDSKVLYDFIYENFEDFRFKDKYEKYLKLKGEDIV